MLTSLLESEEAAADAPLPTQFISVDAFSGTDDERINAAIAAAAATTHKTVFLPNDTYYLRDSVQLRQGTNTAINLIGESSDGVFLLPDVAYLSQQNIYNNGNGERIAHMINLDQGGVFNSVDVSIQNMTIDMRDQQVMGVTETYNTVGHGIRVGQGWQSGQFTVNHVNIRNTGSYGIGVQNRDEHPADNLTLTNLNIERTGSDGIDTKDANGAGNRNLVINNVSINEVGFLDTGAAPAIDIRYRTASISNVNIVSQPSHSTLPGQTSSIPGINFRPNGGTIEATVSDVYVRGTNNAVQIQSSDTIAHNNIDLFNFIVHGFSNTGVRILGNNHSGHSISDGFTDPVLGGTAISTGGFATVTNVVQGPWDPALTPTTDTTAESNVVIAGETFSPAWEGLVGSERISLNPTAPSTGTFMFDVSQTGTLQIDFDGFYNAADQLIVDGVLNLGGELEVNLVSNAPSTAGVYQIFDANSITGSFDTITLPTAGPGLEWNTDLLGVNGTISLLEVPSITLGDTNTSYSASSPDDNPFIDPSFQSDIATAFPAWTFLGLDQTGRNDVRAMTFVLDPLNANDLESVTIEARIRGESGYENDAMALDAVGNTRGIASFDGFNTNGDWMTVTYELDPSEFALLSDGQLNLAFFDDTRVDWVNLTWELSISIAGDYNDDGVVDLADYTVWRDNVGAPAATLPNDTDSGVIGAAQYATWLANFGQGLPAPSSQVFASVPEPTTALMTSMFLLIAVYRRSSSDRS